MTGSMERHNSSWKSSACVGLSVIYLLGQHINELSETVNMAVKRSFGPMHKYEKT